MISKDLQENKTKIKELFNNSSDVIAYEFETLANDMALVIYINGLVDKEALNDHILRPLMESLTSPLDIKSTVSISAIEESNDMDNIITAITSSNVILFHEGLETAYILNLCSYEKRAIPESQNEQVIRGPKEAFVEDIFINKTLIRRKIRNKDLVFEDFVFGQQTNTKVAIFYMNGIVNMEVLAELKERLGRIKLDTILDVGYMKVVFGKGIGKGLGLLYAFYLIMLSINAVTIQSELIVTNFLVNASNSIIIALMIGTAMYLVGKGIINIVTSSEILVPISLLIIMILAILGIFLIDLTMILPILKYSSFKDMNLGAMQLTLYYTDIFFLVMIVPELENKKDINKMFFITTVVSLLILVIGIIVVFGSVGVEASRHSNFPFLLFSKTLRNVGFLYLATRAIRDVFNKTEKDRIILFIVCGISGLVSMLILRERSVIGIRKLFDLYYGILYVIFVIIIPILTIIVYFFRRKSINMKMESQSKLEDGKSK